MPSNVSASVAHCEYLDVQGIFLAGTLTLSDCARQAPVPEAMNVECYLFQQNWKA